VGRSRGGLTTKIHALVDADGRPVRLILTPGQAGDAPVAPDLLTDLRAGATLIADRAYDTDAIRALATERGAWANIPPRVTRKGSFAFNRWVYRQRNQVERFFNRIKNFRGIATRYDRTDANYLAGLTLAAIRVWLKSYESTA
jgi:transposase